MSGRFPRFQDRLNWVGGGPRLGCWIRNTGERCGSLFNNKSSHTITYKYTTRHIYKSTATGASQHFSPFGHWWHGKETHNTHKNLSRVTNERKRVKALRRSGKPVIIAAKGETGVLSVSAKPVLLEGGTQAPHITSEGGF